MTTILTRKQCRLKAHTRHGSELQALEFRETWFGLGSAKSFDVILTNNPAGESHLMCPMLGGLSAEHPTGSPPDPGRCGWWGT